ncbi:hypothetical protein K438DRAFT_1984937 [Mycena galopus ATCC 62051]|nr:hypothetical protein K438DRAFT_1984937 [Mycena galopus ATCC 62051]
MSFMVCLLLYANTMTPVCTIKLGRVDAADRGRTNPASSYRGPPLNGLKAAVTCTSRPACAHCRSTRDFHWLPFRRTSSPTSFPKVLAANRFVRGHTQFLLRVRRYADPTRNPPRPSSSFHAHRS